MKSHTDSYDSKPVGQGTSHPPKENPKSESRNPKGESAAKKHELPNGEGEQSVVIRGRIQKGVAVLEAASVPEGTEVAVVVPVASKAACEEMLAAERQRVLQIMDRIAALPIEGTGEPFSGAEHDKVLYGAP